MENKPLFFTFWTILVNFCLFHGILESSMYIQNRLKLVYVNERNFRAIYPMNFIFLSKNETMIRNRFLGQNFKVHFFDSYKPKIDTKHHFSEGTKKSIIFWRLKNRWFFWKKNCNETKIDDYFGQKNDDFSEKSWIPLND